MHELSIAENVVDVVRKNVKPKDLSYVRAVNMRIGAMAGIVIDSLEFSFKAITAQTPLAGADLVIDRVPSRIRCIACNATLENPAGLGMCPFCSGTDIQIVSGAELDVVSIELSGETSEAV